MANPSGFNETLRSLCATAVEKWVTRLAGNCPDSCSHVSTLRLVTNALMRRSSALLKRSKQMADLDDSGLISAAWEKYQKSKNHWDFKNGPFRCPLPISFEAVTALDGDADVSDETVDVVTFRREGGYFNGNPCWQFIGALRGTEVVVALSGRNTKKEQS